MLELDTSRLWLQSVFYSPTVTPQCGEDATPRSDPVPPLGVVRRWRRFDRTESGRTECYDALEVRDSAKSSEGEGLRELMIRYQAGEVGAFDELYRRLAPRLRSLFRASRLVAGADPEDLLQSAFLQIHRARHTYSPVRPVEPWIFAIARNVYRMDRRSRGRKQSREVPAEDEPEMRQESAAAALLARDRLERGLRRTTPSRRAAVLLHHVLGFSFKEIGAFLGVRPAAAKLRSSRGMADLRRELGGAGNGGEE